jgi:hypothetical protein
MWISGGEENSRFWLAPLPQLSGKNFQGIE